MQKDISPEFRNMQYDSRAFNFEIMDDKYIDKGNLTSRECGKLVKGMVSEYQKRFR